MTVDLYWNEDFVVSWRANASHIHFMKVLLIMGNLRGCWRRRTCKGEEGGREGIVRGNGMPVQECQGSGMVFDSVQYGHSSMGRTESHCTVVNTICYDVAEARAAM